MKLNRQPKPQQDAAVDRSKKTRDLPNLSQCQSCGFRIDVCSGGKTGLQTLYSEWRIVLLCKNCFVLVESSQICSYCFKESSPINPFISCCQCKRIVHRSCFSDYGDVAPWSYSCSGNSDFFTCIDCWIPKSLAAKRRVPRSGKKRKFLESRSFKENHEKKSMEAAAMARELAVKKTLIARGAMELASNPSDLLAKEGNCGGGSKPDGDDSRFAFQLHRAMNSSPRIVKKFRSVNSSSSVKRKLPECNDETMDKVSGAKNSRGSSKRELVCGISRSSVCHSLKHADYSGADTIKKRRTANVATLGLQSKEGVESCSTNKLINSGADDNSTNSACQYFRQENEIMIPEGERCYRKPDRYLMKYSRRKLKKRLILDSRPLSSSECIHCGNQPLAIEPLQSCLKESTSFSNSSQHSSLKAPICSSGLSPEQYREENAIMTPEDERCCKQPDWYLMMYSRRKLNKRNGAGALRMGKTANVENSESQPKEGEESCSNKLINSSVDDKSMNSASQYFREENEIMIPEDERCCRQPNRYLMKYSRRKLPNQSLMKYSRRKLNKRNGADTLRMRQNANAENSESQPKEGKESHSNKLINSSVDDKNMNSASQSCKEENETMIPEVERCCGQPNRYLIKYSRRKLPNRYLMKYSRRNLNKRNGANTLRMRQTANVENLELQPKEGEESCYNKLMNSSVDDNSVNSASQSFSEEDEIMIPVDERCFRQPNRSLMKYSRRKLFCWYLMKYGRRKLLYWYLMKHSGRKLPIRYMTNDRTRKCK